MSKFFEIFFVDFVYPNLHPGLTRPSLDQFAVYVFCKLRGQMQLGEV